MTTNRITSINALRAAFAAPTTPPSLDRSALTLLDDALATMTDDADLLDDFHDDPFSYLLIDADTPDAPITTDDLRAMIARES